MSHKTLWIQPGRLKPINPESLGPPRGYSNGILAPPGGQLLFVAGQIAWDSDQNLVGETFADQFEQALANVIEVVRAAGGEAIDVAQLTIYVVDAEAYLASLGEVGERYRRLMGRHYPTMALVEVSRLVEPGAQVEIQAQAVICEPQVLGEEDDDT